MKCTDSREWEGRPHKKNDRRAQNQLRMALSS